MKKQTVAIFMHSRMLAYELRFLQLMTETHESWLKHCKELQILWKHNGDMNTPHAELTKGGHSDGFFNGEKIVRDPRVCDMATGDLTASLVRSRVYLGRVELVIGPAFGAITLAHDMARNLSFQVGRPILSGYAEKEKDENGKDRLILSRCKPQPGQKVLAVEDTITSGASVLSMINLIKGSGAEPLPVIVALMNRSGHSEVDGYKIISLLTVPMNNWEKDGCPLCKQGSVALRPKGENWKKFVSA